MSLATEKAALAPLNFTAVAPVKPDPVTVTPVAAEPLVGVKLEMEGLVVTVNDDALVPVPPGPVTAIGPVVAPFGTVAEI